MREILFKGKRVQDGTWVEGFYFEESGSFIKEKSSSVSTPTHLIDPETVCQYTGFTDRNSNKIFEGDIVVIGYHEEFLYVALDGPSWECMSKKHIHYRHRLEHGTPYEIVGNIHNDLDYERLLGCIRRSGPDKIARYQPW